MKYWIRLCVVSLFLTSAALCAKEPSGQDSTDSKKTEAVQSVEKDTIQSPAAELPGPAIEETAEEDRPAIPTYEGAFLKMILVLLLLLFVIFFGIWAIRRLSRSRLHMFKEPKHIRIIDRRPLSPKTALYLVEVGNKRVLIAESQLEVKGLVSEDLTGETERD